MILQIPKDIPFQPLFICCLIDAVSCMHNALEITTIIDGQAPSVHWCIWHVGTTQDPEDIIHSPCDDCGSQEQPPDAILFPIWSLTDVCGSLDILPAAHHKRTTTVLSLHAVIRGLPPDWKRPSGRLSHTWLRAVEADLGQQNIGLASAWKKAAIRDDWRRIVDTTTLLASGVCYKRRKEKKIFILLKLKKLSTNSYEFIWRLECLKGNKAFDFAAVPDHDPYPKKLTEFFTTVGQRQ